MHKCNKNACIVTYAKWSLSTPGVISIDTASPSISEHAIPRSSNIAFTDFKAKLNQLNQTNWMIIVF